MNSQVFKYGFSFILLVALQVLVVNNLDLNFYLNPYIYILFLLSLPFTIPNWMLMAIAMFLGLSIDMFSNTLGLHAASAVFLAFLRPFIINILTQKNGYEPNDLPNPYFMGQAWFFAYAGILTFAYHLFYFSVEIFSLTSILIILGKTLASSVLALMIVYLLSLLFATTKKRR